MAITGYTQQRFGDLVVVTVTSDLAPPIYFHWYVDGSYISATIEATFTIGLGPDEQVRIECIDTTDADFDPIANAPEGWPARRTLWWTRPTDTDVDHYLIEQQQDGGEFAAIGTIHQWTGQWDYSFLTEPMDDLSVYSWRITPYDAAGNAGAATTIGPEKIVRTPDAPDYTVSFDPETEHMTFEAA